MRRYTLLVSVILVLLVTAVMCAAAVKPAPKKPPVKPPAKPTVQLAGDKGVFGQVYSLCKSSPVYFRMKSAEYTVDQVRIGDRLYYPRSDEKLLVMHFSLQNPQKQELYVRWDTLRFTVVDAMNVNHEGWNNDWGDEMSKNKLQMSLKPAQKVDVYTLIAVPAKGVVPKLMVLPSQDDDGPILRYNLMDAKNKVAPLKPPFADPADSSGYTALETIPAEVGTMYPHQDFDAAVQKYDYTTAEIEDNPPDEGMRFFLVTMTVKNQGYEDQYLRWDAFQLSLLSTDGEELRYRQMLLATANRPFGRGLKAGEEVTVRLCFNVPDDATPKTLTVKQDETRTYEYQIP